MKTLKTRMIAWVLAFCTVLGMAAPTIPALAATPAEELADVNIYNGNFDMTYLYMGNSAIHTDYVYFLKDGNQIPAYCITPHNWGVQWVAPAGGSVPYTLKGAVTDPKVMGIIAGGFPHRSYQELGLENAEQGFYATKTALWCYLRSDYNIDNLKVNSSLTGTELTRAQNMLAAAKQIYNAGIGNTVIPVPSLTISALDSIAVDGGSRYYQRFEITSGTWVSGQKATVNLNANDYGARVADMSGNYTNAIAMTGSNETGYKGYFQIIYPIGGEGVIGIPAGTEDASGSINISATATVYQYELYSVTPKNPTSVPPQYSPMQDYIADLFDATTNKTAAALSKWETKKDDPDPDGDPDPVPEIPLSATLTVRKYATGTNTPLAGASFEVRSGSGQAMGTYSTNTSGYFTLSLDAGTYFVTEVSPPANYLLGSDTTQNVTLSEGGSRTLTFYNAPYGNLRVEKRNAANGATLSGAVVRVRNIVTGTIYTETTGIGGAFTLSKIELSMAM